MVDNKTLRHAYSVKGRDDVRNLYQGWADTYDTDLTDELGYVAPQMAVQALLSHVDPSSAPIADLGCGTGLAGVLLREAGFNTIDGYDLSPEMLEKVAEKSVYRHLREADLTKPIEPNAESYARAICVGAFAYSHLGPVHISAILKNLAPGGVLTFTINERFYESEGYAPALDKIQADGLAEMLELDKTDYIQAEGIGCWMCSQRT